MGSISNLLTHTVSLVGYDGSVLHPDEVARFFTGLTDYMFSKPVRKDEMSMICQVGRSIAILDYHHTAFDQQ